MLKLDSVMTFDLEIDKAPIYITSDWHLGHRRLELESYSGRPKDFENLIVEGVRSLPDDSFLINLGDLFLMNRDEALEKYLKPINDELYIKRSFHVLVPGNHCRQKEDWYRDAGFITTGYVEVRTKYGLVKLAHFPEEKLDPKYVCLIHGHCHGKGERHQFPRNWSFSLEKDGFTPLPIDEVIANALENTI